MSLDVCVDFLVARGVSRQFIVNGVLLRKDQDGGRGDTTVRECVAEYMAREK